MTSFFERMIWNFFTKPKINRAMHLANREEFSDSIAVIASAYKNRGALVPSLDVPVLANLLCATCYGRIGAHDLSRNCIDIVLAQLNRNRENLSENDIRYIWAYSKILLDYLSQVSTSDDKNIAHLGIVEGYDISKVSRYIVRQFPLN